MESIAYVLPAAITGFVAYYMLKGLIKQQNTTHKIQLMAEKKKESLPIKLQAYERMLLFCERINPVKMLLRVKPLSDNTNDYLQLIIANIDQEFEHNLVQQIYISKDAWLAIVAAKRTVVNKLKQVAEVSNSANNFRESILIDYAKTLPPTETAVDIIKSEVRKLL